MIGTGGRPCSWQEAVAAATEALAAVLLQRLQETKRATADRTRGERERRERRAQEKEAAKLNHQCASCYISRPITYFRRMNAYEQKLNLSVPADGQ